MMMNDFLGQHMVITSAGCIAFSSDIFDWPALVQMCAFLQAGVRPPSKTYDWIAGAFTRHRPHRTIAPELSSNVQNTITELLLELVDRQVNPREDTTKLGSKHLRLLDKCVRCLLETATVKFCPNQKEPYHARAGNQTSGTPPIDWASGAHNDVQKGARNAADVAALGSAKEWYGKTTKEAAKHLEQAATYLTRLMQPLDQSQGVGHQRDGYDTSVLETPPSGTGHDGYDTSVLGQVPTRCKRAQGWKQSAKRRGHVKRTFPEVYDMHWWPTGKHSALEFHSTAGEELSEVVPSLDYNANKDSVGAELWNQIHASQGGMVKVSNINLEKIWNAMKAWLHDPKVQNRTGGSQASLSTGKADFQVLRTERSQPKPLTEARTLGDFLAKDWGFPVAAVGLSAYGDGVQSTTTLRDAILDVLASMGFNTSEEEDVLGLAGVDVSGVGVRRPEVYIKLGQTDDAYWTLRHPEWGGTRGYNTNLVTWETGQPLLRPATASTVHNIEQAPRAQKRRAPRGLARKQRQKKWEQDAGQEEPEEKALGAAPQEDTELEAGLDFIINGLGVDSEAIHAEARGQHMACNDEHHQAQNDEQKCSAAQAKQDSRILQPSPAHQTHDIIPDGTVLPYSPQETLHVRAPVHSVFAPVEVRCPSQTATGLSGSFTIGRYNYGH